VNSVHGLYEQFRHMIHEVAKFGVVGAVGFVVSLGGADILRFDAGLGKYTAVTIATVAATIVTFVGNRYWTFRSRKGSGTARESVMFFVMNGVGILIQYASIAIIQDGLGLSGKLWFNLANLLGIAIGTVFRWWSYRKWVWGAPIDAVLEGEVAAQPAEPAGASASEQAGR
jgi:putative flippase GtrA